ncbi:MAG: hypothetical protein UX55_C0044G0009 [Candidatus Azambacteria bacterium GW2011_GWE2_46_45]|uniref:Uncharacterized protein n=1 Tax=Candidatus Azambacteria bacterium GW2011_GWE2_46_45 TaxID=1618625 RepID=A0A0G1Q311_9BACT|nr:MAG: hypothetical protein UX55_C0044G0009 [Candidatus Azambacteria bacterium GW2011_GWE2_46_45]
MAGQRSVNRQRSRFLVADFADHNDVRVLPEQRPQAVRESQTDVRPYLGLIDAFNAIFNRVFNS